MGKFSGFKPFTASCLIGVLLLFCGPAAAQESPSATTPNPRTGRDLSHGYSVTGKVSDSESHSQMDGVRVDLRAFSGATVATAFTRGGGSFEFRNIPGGSYDAVVQQIGYQSLIQRIDVDGPVYGMSLELRANSSANSATAGKPSVSSRELSIPRKAREDMQKGLDLLYGKSDYQGSIKLLESAIKEYPDYYEAHAQMGVAFLHLKNPADAEQSLRKSVQLSEEHYVDALFWLATVLSDNGRFAEAEGVARKGVELDPSSWQANAELARALLGLDRPAEAEKNALTAVKLQPGTATLYLILANVHGQTQNDPALLEDLNNYLRLAPTGPSADQARAQRKQLQEELGDAKGNQTPPNLTPQP